VIILVVGNIGAGKSTYIKSLYNNLNTTETPYVVMARDAIRYMIGGGNYVFNPDLENSVWKSELDMIYNFIKLGCNIIVDEVGINKNMRQRYIKVAKNYNTKIIAIVFPRLSMKESVDRRMNNPHNTPSRVVWEKVWTKFDIQYEEVTLDEGFSQIIPLSINSIGL